MSLPISYREAPFIRLLAPFMVGIACQYWFHLFSFSIWNYLLIILLLFSVFIGYFLASRWQFRWIFGFTINLFFLFFGIFVTIKQPTSSKLTTNNRYRSILYLLDNPQLRNTSIRAEAEIKYIQENDKWQKVHEKILVYFNLKDSSAANLKYGDELAVEIIPQSIRESGNPNQFNYKKYLADRQVYYTAFLKTDNWVKLENHGGFLKKIALQLRERLVIFFRASGLSGDELAVASALTLGYQDLLDDELRKVYSGSGAMHILSVSGLHVGVLYMLLSFLLSFLNGFVLTRAIKSIVLLTFLWFFALITGLPPCVQRSALMFSFIVIGDFFISKSSIYNTLAASAFVLLVINPYNLLDIGFQLSYLAVVSIVFFYPYIYNLVYIKNWAMDKIWSLIAVSIAAQIGTLSICIFYFQQFPNYFLLANLIAIPLSTIALYIAVLLIALSPFPILAGYIGKAFSFIVSLLNHGLEYIEKLPYSVTEGLHISVLQMAILFAVILVLSLFLILKRRTFIFIGFSLVILFLTLNLKSKIQIDQTNEFIVYDINKRSLLSFREGENLIFMDFDKNKTDFMPKYQFYTNGYISSVGATKSYKVINPFCNDIKENGSKLDLINQYGVLLIQFNDKRIAVQYDRILNNYMCYKKLDVDYLVINRFSSVDIFDFLNPKKVILDASVSKSALAEIVTQCKKYGIPYHITSIHGACIVNANAV